MICSKKEKKMIDKRNKSKSKNDYINSDQEKVKVIEIENLK